MKKKRKKRKLQSKNIHMPINNKHYQMLILKNGIPQQADGSFNSPAQNMAKDGIISQKNTEKSPLIMIMLQNIYDNKQICKS